MESYIYVQLTKSFKEKRNNKTTMTNYFPTEYQHYIYKSRYARWNNELNRREDWPETVSRYMEFMKNHLFKNHNYTIDENVYNETYNAILNLEVLPSMRLLMAAGPAVKRDNVAAYNCSYLPVNAYGDSIKVEHEHLEEPITINIKHPVDFDEAMYILMCGTGVGFSVERQEINNLPTVGNKLSRKMYAANNKNFPNVPKDEISIFDKKTNTIHVHDSKYGWASGFRILLVELFNGNFDVKWDLSQLRPAGAPLKTFGGFSSGPEPLDRLFRHCVDIFKKANGRKLTSLECHDIMCLVGNVIIAGGIRRSALISLSNLSDDRMRHAKSGNWYNVAPHRALANNSAVYDGKPDLETFLREWSALIESKSGERGIINRKAFRDKCESIGRKSDYTFGVNPSLRKGTKVWTTEGVFPIEQLENKSFYVRNLDGEISPANCWLSGKNKKLYKITLSGGHVYYATKEHKWPVIHKGIIKKVSTDLLKPKDTLPFLQADYLTNGVEGTYEDGFIIGWNLGDGWITERENGKQIGFIVSKDKKKSDIHLLIQNYLKINCDWSGSFEDKEEISVNNEKLRKIFEKFGVTNKKEGLPTSVWTYASENFRKGLIDGLFSSDGHVSDNEISINSAKESLIRDLSELLSFYGVYNTVNKRIIKDVKFPNGKTYNKEYSIFTLKISKSFSKTRFKNLFNLTHKDKKNKLDNIKVSTSGHKMVSKVKSVEETSSYEDVWDIQVHDSTHCFQLSHCVTGNCGEVILRNFQFCNLSTIVARENDTAETLKKKARIATLLGTWQSTLTNFRYLRPIWKENCDEERLLGVSITGIMDCKALTNIPYINGEEHTNILEELLSSLRLYVRRINKEEAARIGINKSAAITLLKPEGTVSQLTNTSSGIHARYAPYYIRRVRGENHHPLTKFLKSVGVPNEPDVSAPDTTTVFSFPQKAPENSIKENTLTSAKALRFWRLYRDYWCDHNPSTTIHVKEDEWLEVGDWVYKNFDSIGGLSFLPYSNHTYMQAPYEKITEEQYNALVEKMPVIDWSRLQEFEVEDNTTSSQEFACTGNVCEIVDIGKK